MLARAEFCICLFCSLLLSAATAAGQVVQLPSFHSFGSDTTVLVPDRGATSLGGMSTGRAGSNYFSGLPPQRGIGIDRSSASLSVTARIHDLEEMDRALLEQAVASKKRVAASSIPAAAPDGALPSVADIKRQHAARRAAQAKQEERERNTHLTKARAARDAGKSSLARTHYDMAARRATGDVLRGIEAERRALPAPHPNPQPPTPNP